MHKSLVRALARYMRRRRAIASHKSLGRDIARYKSLREIWLSTRVL